MAGQHSGWTRLLGAVCCALGLSAALPAHAIVLRTAAQEGTEPKFVADGKDRVVGLCIDILRAVEQVDPTLQFVGDQRWKPLIRAFSELETGQQDVQCAMQRTAEREQRFHYLGPALYAIEYHFLARAEDTISITQWEDVRRLAPDNIVLINRGFAAAAILTQMGGIEIDANATNPQLNLQKLIAGRGRLFFHRGPGLQRLLVRTGTVGKVRILPQVMYSAKLYFVTSKKLAPFITERLERALYQLEKNGELDRLMRKWD